MNRTATVFMVLLSFATLAVNAQYDPNLARGTSALVPYQAGDIDQVNLYNGNLSVAIPLAGGLTLTYDGKLWDHRRVGTNEPFRYRKDPTARSNAGLGWRVSLGRLIGPTETDVNEQAIMRYEDAGGGDHVFYGTLHDGEGVPIPELSYTRDGSYIRLRLLDGSYWVEFPDGSAHRFDSWNDTARGFTRWRLTEIRDAHPEADSAAANSITISYATADRWIIKDEFARETIVAFTSPPANVQSPPSGNTPPTFSYYDKVVDWVQTPAFDGSTALYDFSYEMRYVQRGYCDAGAITGDSTHVSVPVLTQLVLPVVNSILTYNMKYYEDDPGGTPSSPCFAGMLNKVQLPSRGEVRWTYMKLSHAARRCRAFEPVNAFAGVFRRGYYANAAATTGDQWQYDYAVSPGFTDGDCEAGEYKPLAVIPVQLTNTVTSPALDQTIYYFNIDRKGNRVGMPYSPLERIGTPTDGSDRYLSRRQCDGMCADGNVLRSSYVKYESDYTSATAAYNTRQVASRTIFNDDGGTSRYVDVLSYDFDGLGHYRTVKETSVGFGGITSREQTTRYNRRDTSINPDMAVYDSGEYRSGATFVVPTMLVPWRLDRFPEKSVTSGGKTFKTQYCFNRITGFLTGERNLTGGSPGVTDRLAIFSSDPAFAGGTANAVTGERSYGGEVKTLPAGLTGACTAPAAANLLGYETRHTYVGGQVVQSEYLADGSPIGVKALDQDHDFNTGFLKTSRDTAGVATSYEYDSLGRLEKVTSAGLADVVYTWTDPTATTRAKLKVLQTSASPGAAGSIGSETEFDYRGRPVIEKSLAPNGTWVQREIAYDPMGRRASVSEWDNPSKTTRVPDYDALGRPLRILAPDVTDASGFTTKFKYTGSRVREQTSRIATASAGGETSSVTTEEYDAFGHLIAVTQPSGPTSSAAPVGVDVKAEYRYAGGRVSEVSVRRADGSGAVQRRFFDYDNLGQLLSEQHPESGITRYRNYDARGHATLKLQGPVDKNYIFDLQLKYDAAERLTEVHSRDPFYSASQPAVGGEFRLSKAFVYETANDGTNLVAGKLQTATRYNYGATHETLPARNGARFIVTEQYEYRDAAGRKTKRTTTIHKQTGDNRPLIPVKQIEQVVDYNDLGLVKSLHYPTCANCAVSSGPSTISPTYAGGRVTSLPGYVTGTTYWPSGMRKVLTHSNGIADTVAADPDVTGRPKSIAFGSYSTCTAPSVVVPPEGSTIGSGQTATLSVVVNGSGPLQVQWFRWPANAPPTEIAGATGTSYQTPALSQTSIYFVRVSNACRTVDSATVTVTISCAPPVINAESASSTVPANHSVALSVDASGTAPLTFVWYRGAVGDESNPVGGNASTFQTPALTVTTSYWVKLTNSCGSATSGGMLLTVPLAAPRNLVATRNGAANEIVVSWSPVANAHQYRVERRSALSTFTTVAPSVAGTSWIDTAVAPGAAYIYRAVALDAAGGSVSSVSNRDLASLVTFTPIDVDAFVDDSHFHELLNAVNVMRAAVGRGALMWTQILSSGIPAPADGVVIHSGHVAALRIWMDDTLQAAGVGVQPYSDASLANELIRLAHLTELRQRTQ